jgi:hypothetical protein
MKYKVGDIIRIPVTRGFRVWKITGICLGATGVENNYQLQPLDAKTGQDVGGVTTENLVPCDMLESHSGIKLI